MSPAPHQSADDADHSGGVIVLDERVMIRRYRDGDKGAFEDLVRRVGPAICSYIRRAGVTNADVDDVAQEVFVKIHAHLDTVDLERPIRPWVFTIAVNAARSNLRSRGRRNAHEISRSDIDATEEAATNEPTADETAQSKQTAEVLQQALEGLPPAQREAVLLVCVRGMKQNEAAAILEVNANTLKTNLRRARIVMAQRLAKTRLVRFATGDDQSQARSEVEP